MPTRSEPSAIGTVSRRALLLTAVGALVCGCATNPRSAEEKGAATDASRRAASASAVRKGSMGKHAESTVGPARRANFGSAAASASAREVADWVVASGDHGGLPFLLVDKLAARLFVFDATGRLRGQSPVLLGFAPGDETVPGIGERPIAGIRPHERTTPAGRFVAERGRNAHGEDIVWVDYDAAVSMHRVRATNRSERRLERLRTPTVRDNRISYGCINVPAAFYDRFVVPSFGGGSAIVYVLPETGSARARFGIPHKRADLDS